MRAALEAQGSPLEVLPGTDRNARSGRRCEHVRRHPSGRKTMMGSLSHLGGCGAYAGAGSFRLVRDLDPDRGPESCPLFLQVATISLQPMNTLFYGDNLDVLRQHVADATVDLVYLDPPFQSGKDYNVIFESRRGERGDERAQAEAFKDTWRWGRESEEQYAEIEQAGGALATALRALRAMLG